MFSVVQTTVRALRTGQLIYEITKKKARAPVAQSVEPRTVMREVVSSTPAGPTLRVLKQLRIKCCLCNYIHKWLDFKSSRIRTINRRPCLTTVHCSVKGESF